VGEREREREKKKEPRQQETERDNHDNEVKAEREIYNHDTVVNLLYIFYIYDLYQLTKESLFKQIKLPRYQYLHYQDDWYILDAETSGKNDGAEDFVLVYYRGRNDAWDG
jgi:hypothetical protein